MKETTRKTTLLKVMLPMGLALVLMGCPPGDNDIPPACAEAGAATYRDIALNMAEQGAGAVFYKQDFDIIDPTPQCDAYADLLEIRMGGDSTGVEARLLLPHKAPGGTPVTVLASEPAYYISVEVGQPLTGEQLSEVFDGDLIFPITSSLLVALAYPSTTTNIPTQITAHLEWEWSD